jgi:uncharacterized membrane protein YeaQ/YmgE (transglycosylase-associated protein family)
VRLNLPALDYGVIAVLRNKRDLGAVTTKQEVLMDGLLFWFLMVGFTGWFTGKVIGETGYGKALGDYADGLDAVLGIVGAAIVGYLFFGAVSGEGSSFGRYATAMLGSMALVGVARLVSARYLPSSSH